MGSKKMSQKEEIDEEQRSREKRQWVDWEGLGLWAERGQATAAAETSCCLVPHCPRLHPLSTPVLTAHTCTLCLHWHSLSTLALSQTRPAFPALHSLTPPLASSNASLPPPPPLSQLSHSVFCLLSPFKILPSSSCSSQILTILPDPTQGSPAPQSIPSPQ